MLKLSAKGCTTFFFSDFKTSLQSCWLITDNLNLETRSTRTATPQHHVAQFKSSRQLSTHLTQHLHTTLCTQGHFLLRADSFRAITRHRKWPRRLEPSAPNITHGQALCKRSCASSCMLGKAWLVAMRQENRTMQVLSHQLFVRRHHKAAQGTH